jgi:predicted nucleic acid-binding protein
MEIFIESPDVYFHSVYYKWNMIDEDPDDNKFFDIAVAANADFIITNDAHFNKIKAVEFPKVNIVSSADFLEILKRV